MISRPRFIKNRREEAKADLTTRGLYTVRFSKADSKIILRRLQQQYSVVKDQLKVNYMWAYHLFSSLGLGTQGSGKPCLYSSLLGLGPIFTSWHDDKWKYRPTLVDRHVWKLILCCSSSQKTWPHIYIYIVTEGLFICCRQIDHSIREFASIPRQVRIYIYTDSDSDSEKR